MFGFNYLKGKIPKIRPPIEVTVGSSKIAFATGFNPVANV
jgi:hypothetical protein